MRWIALGVSLLLAGGSAYGAAVQFDLNIGLPDVVRDSAQPRACTIAYLVSDVTNNDTYAVRMQITPLQNATSENGRLPCPSVVPSRVAARALNACVERAADPKTCVFSDMSREFTQAPEVRNTAENSARCLSDSASFIGIACWRSGGLDVCNVGCGGTQAEAEAAARERCETKQLQSCPTVGAVPVLAP